MKTRLLFILLFLGGVLFFGCKKDKIIQEPNILVEQDSLKHIMDSINLVSLESTLVGSYVVSGIEIWGPSHSTSSDTINNDTITITRYNGTFLVIGFHSSDPIQSQYFNFVSQPLYPDTVTTPYYNFIYPNYSSNTYPENDRLSFPKNNTDSIFIFRFASYNSYIMYNLSGVKIH